MSRPGAPSNTSINHYAWLIVRYLKPEQLPKIQQPALQPTVDGWRAVPWRNPGRKDGLGRSGAWGCSGAVQHPSTEALLTKNGETLRRNQQHDGKFSREPRPLQKPTLICQLGLSSVLGALEMPQCNGKSHHPARKAPDRDSKLIHRNEYRMILFLFSKTCISGRFLGRTLHSGHSCITQFLPKCLFCCCWQLNEFWHLEISWLSWVSSGPTYWGHQLHNQMIFLNYLVFMNSIPDQTSAIRRRDKNGKSI